MGELVRAPAEEQVADAVEADLGAPVTVSIGGALFPDHAKDAHTLLSAADEALYRAKLEGRNRVVCPPPIHAD